MGGMHQQGSGSSDFDPFSIAMELGEDSKSPGVFNSPMGGGGGGGVGMGDGQIQRPPQSGHMGVGGNMRVGGQQDGGMVGVRYDQQRQGAMQQQMYAQAPQQRVDENQRPNDQQKKSLLQQLLSE